MMRFFESLWTFFRSIQVTLVCVFVGGMVLSSTVVLFYMNDAFTDDFALLEDEKKEALTKYAAQTIKERFKSTAYVGKSLAHFLKSDFSFERSFLAPFVVHYLANAHFLRGITVVDKKGCIFNTLKITPSSVVFWNTYMRASRQPYDDTLVQKTSFASQLDLTAIGGGIHWSFYDDYEVLIYTRYTENIPSVERFKSSWFLQAFKDNKPKMSLPISFVFGGAGLVVSYPVIDDKTKVHQGLVGLNIDLEKVSGLLQGLVMGNTKSLWLVNKEGYCLASSKFEDSFVLSKKGLTPKKLLQINQAWGLSFHAFLKNPNITWENEDKTRELFFTPIDIEAHEFPFLNGVFLAIYKGNDYRRLGFYASQAETAILVGCVIVVLSILLTVLVAHISRPVKFVAQALGAFEQMRFQVMPYKPSYFYEIDRIGQAFSNVSRALSSFGKFVPITLVRQLMGAQQEALLGGTEERVTIMFSDIQEFTNISEKLTPQDLVANLSEYFQECTRVIQDNQGTLDKYIGDAVMAFWGAPYKDAFHVVHACQAVLGCHSRLKQMNSAWEKLGKPPFKSRFGLCTGSVIVGNFGSADRFQYTVIGDSVNLASRLESLNKVYGTLILVDEETYLKAKDYFVFRVVDKVAVKGKDKGVLIYELLCALDDSSQAGGGYLFDLALYMEQAFSCYQQREWSRALKRYRFIYQSFHEDSVAELFMARCEHFLQNPPGDDWDGITRMQTK